MNTPTPLNLNERDAYLVPNFTQTNFEKLKVLYKPLKIRTLCPI